jgi:hypothetical protein
MKSRITRTFFQSAIVVWTLSSLLPDTISAQSIWLPRSQERAVSLEFLKPDMEGGFFNYSFMSSTTFLSLRMPLSQMILFVSEIPFVHAGFQTVDADGNLIDVTENALGNPYIGIELQGKNSTFFTEAGLRLPLTSYDTFQTLFLSLYTDSDRTEAFLLDVLSITGLVNVYHKFPSNLMVRFRAGPVVWIVTDSESYSDEVEMIFRYGLQEGYVSVRLPLDEDLNNIIDFVIGLHLTVELK